MTQSMIDIFLQVCNHEKAEQMVSTISQGMSQGILSVEGPFVQKEDNQDKYRNSMDSMSVNLFKDTKENDTNDKCPIDPNKCVDCQV